MEIFFNFPHPFSLSPCLLFKVLSDDKSYSDSDLAMTPRINVLLLTCLIREEFQGESDHYFYIKMVFGLNTLPNGCLPVAPYLPPSLPCPTVVLIMIPQSKLRRRSFVPLKHTWRSRNTHSLAFIHRPTHPPTLFHPPPPPPPIRAAFINS